MKYDRKWYDGLQTLRSGDACEVRWYARDYWMKARVITNGGSGFWEAELTEPVTDEISKTSYPVGFRVKGLYAEHVRAIATEPTKP